ncbi:MAG: XrtA-associated tyrosine autokinase [Thiobacillaceae bacterium]
MSIIEKAANKLGASPSSSSPIRADDRHESVINGGLIEAAVARRHAPAAIPDQESQVIRDISDEIESQVDVVVTGETQLVDLPRLKKMGAITPDAEKSQIAEEFRIIKRPLIANAFGQGTALVKNGNLIMITSSLPGEGKSFCAINLAISMAMEMDRTVLLVDADVARPRLPEYLGIHADKGLLDVLQDKNLHLSDVLIKTNIAKLTVLPAGRTYKRATELLASAAMTRLVEDIGNRYHDRIIIFDSPPLLATSEASVLATHMGQIVMVVEAEKTSQEAVTEALNHIQSCEVVSMLLNKTSGAPGADYYYGYYGSYGK